MTDDDPHRDALIAEYRKLKEKKRVFDRAPFFFFEPYNEEQSKFSLSPAKIRIVTGGNRCLAPDQLIYDPVLDLHRPVSEINGEHHVLAWDGNDVVVAQALAPFEKEEPASWMYEVGLSNGESFHASGDHLVLTPESWAPVKSLTASSELILPGSTPAEITSLDKTKTHHKWDFTVPTYHNYLAGGVVHHNSGKSTIGIIEMIAHCMGFRPDGSRTNLPPPPIDALYIVKDKRKSVDKIIMRKLQQYCAPGWITKIKNGTDGMPEIIDWSTGSRLWIGSHNQDPASYEGQDWWFVIYDEPPPRSHWIPVRRGCVDHGGRVCFVMTPIKCPWLYNELYSKADGTRIETFNLVSWDNPHLGQEELEEFAQDLTPEERLTRLEGKFSHLQGSIFPTFDRSIHVVPHFNPPDSWPRFMVMDPHDRRPSYLMWAAVSPRGMVYVYNEWPHYEFWSKKSVSLAVKDYVSIIRTEEGREKVYERIIDPNFGRTPSVFTGRTLVEEYEEYGLDFYAEINNDIALGHQRIHELIRTDLGEPKLIVSQKCNNMIWAFENYMWDPKDMEAEFNAKERPAEAGKDQIDALRYLLDYEPTYSMGQRVIRPAEHRGITGYG